MEEPGARGSCPGLQEEGRVLSGGVIISKTRTMSGAQGAGGLAPLPEAVVPLEQAYRHAKTECNDVLRRLKRSMRRAEEQGAGHLSLSPDDDPAAQAIFLPVLEVG